jgi:hypothetical protein
MGIFDDVFGTPKKKQYKKGRTYTGDSKSSSTIGTPRSKYSPLAPKKASLKKRVSHKLKRTGKYIGKEFMGSQEQRQKRKKDNIVKAKRIGRGMLKGAKRMHLF